MNAPYDSPLGGHRGGHPGQSTLHQVAVISNGTGPGTGPRPRTRTAAARQPIPRGDDNMIATSVGTNGPQIESGNARFAFRDAGETRR